jgi:RimJ/RimL family protein N-acetyltransferase
MGDLGYRDLNAGDLDALHEIVSDWDVARFLGSWIWPADRAFTLSRCVPYPGDGFVWAICRDDMLLGTIGLTRGEIGYMIHPRYQGQGIATAAIAHVLSFGFGDMGIDDIAATIWADNAVSRHVLVKFGFEHVQSEIVHSVARDEPTPSETYRLTRTRWQDLSGQGLSFTPARHG